MNAVSSIIANISLKKIVDLMAVYIHEQALEIRKENNIEDGHIKIYSDYVVYPTNNNEYYAFHYVVHVDNQSERFFIVSWTPSTEDEFLDSIKY